MTRLPRPTDVAFNGLYILIAIFSATIARADFLVTSGLGDEILRFDSDGRPFGSFVAPGSGGLNSPASMTWGPDGNLYVGGSYQINGTTHGAIFTYDATTGAFIRRIDFAPFYVLFGLHFTSNGDLLVSTPSPGRDAKNEGMVYRVDPATGRITAELNNPLWSEPAKMLDLPDGRVLVGSTGGLYGHRIFTIDPGTNAVPAMFSQDAALYGPFGMEYGPDGMIYAANMYHNAGISRIDPQTGAVLGSFTVPGVNASLSDLVFQGDRLWASDVMSGALYEFDAHTGAYLQTVRGVSFSYDLLHMPEPGVGAVVILSGSAIFFARSRRK